MPTDTVEQKCRILCISYTEGTVKDYMDGKDAILLEDGLLVEKRTGAYNTLKQERFIVSYVCDLRVY